MGTRRESYKGDFFQIVVFGGLIALLFILSGCYTDRVCTGGGCSVLKGVPVGGLYSVPGLQVVVQNNRFPQGAEVKMDGATIARVPFGESGTVDITTYWGNIDREVGLMITGVNPRTGIPESLTRQYRFSAGDQRIDQWVLDPHSGGYGYGPIPIPRASTGTIGQVVEIYNESRFPVEIRQATGAGFGPSLVVVSPGQHRNLEISGGNQALSLVATQSGEVVAREVFNFQNQGDAGVMLWKIRVQGQRYVPQQHVAPEPQYEPRERRPRCFRRDGRPCYERRRYR